VFALGFVTDLKMIKKGKNIMKTIAFNETEYKLVYTVFEGASKLRIVILKEENDIPSVSTDVDGCDKITIKENDDIVAQYTGFSSLEGIQIFSDYPVYDRTDKVICIDTVNADVQAQIATLTSQVQSQEEAIAELGDTVNTVSETNDTQDQAIIDLSDAVSALTPEEG
jgi:hypothetical protein